MGGWPDSMIWFNQGDPSAAMLQMDNNETQLYMYYLKTVAQVQAAQADPKIGLISAGGSTDPLFVNPVPVNQTKAPGVFNPFEVRTVREALNYLIDRSYIAREIFGGAVATQTTLWYAQTPEFGRDPVFMSQLVQKYAYNLDTARSMVFDGLGTVAGVSFENGQWLFNGNPIEINIVERVEDQRLLIGQYVAAQLRTLGFTVVEQPLTGSAAFAIVYNGPPDTGAWQIYTEGWASTALTAYSDSDVDYYFCGGEGSAIWFTSGGPYSPDPALADVCHRLLYGLYTNITDRESLIEKAVDLGLKQSVRVWTVAGAIFPYAKSYIAPFSYDLAGGPWALYTTRTAQLLTASGAPAVGGQLKVGNRLQFVSPWNPWQGFGWLYDALIQYTFTDPGVWYDPHTGLGIPIRADFAVTTAGPTGTMSVPSTAYTFNTTTNAWDQVGASKTAVSKVTFTYNWGKWHDGSSVNMNDMLYSIALGFRRYLGDISTHDADAALFGTKLLVNTFKGLTVDDATHLTIYTDYWHIDSSYIALVEDLFPALPWTASELSVETTIHDNTRISEVTASNDALTAMDQSKGDTIGFMDRELSDGNVTSAWVPPGFGTGSPFAISSTEASARWTALSAFRTAYGHFYVSNGPYFISTVDTVSSQVTMTRFADYVFPADHWDSLIVPKIPSVAIDVPSQVVPGLQATINATTTVGGTPYDDLSISYLVINPATGGVLFEGTPAHSAAGTWQIVLSGDQTGQLVPGAYTVETVTVGHEAAVPVLTTKSFVVIPALAYFQALLGVQIGLVNNQIDQLQTDLDSANAQLSNANSQINGLTGLLYASVAIAVVSLVVAALSVLMLMRRTPRGGGKQAEPPETMEEPPKGPEEL
jgi:peptide/nickel transport system substrate-binding protein